MVRPRQLLPTMGARSRRKGSRVERDVARLLQQWIGGRWSRVPLSGGWGNRAEFATCGDVITTVAGFPFVIECKGVEGWHLEQLLTSPGACAIATWWRQAKDEAAEGGKKPLLVFTRNFQPLYALLRLADLGAAGLPEATALLRACLDGEQVVICLFETLLPGLKTLFGEQRDRNRNDGETSWTPG